MSSLKKKNILNRHICTTTCLRVTTFFNKGHYLNLNLYYVLGVSYLKILTLRLWFI